MLWFMGSQRVVQTERLNRTEYSIVCMYVSIASSFPVYLLIEA